MSKIVGPSTFLNNFGVRNERIKILYWLDNHGGKMTLSDVIDASIEPDIAVVEKIADFENSGLVQCEPSLPLKDNGSLSDISNSSSEVVLTEQGRTMLKYA